MSIRVADTKLWVTSQEGVQKVQTGPILRSDETYSAGLYADEGARLLAKTFIKPEGGAVPAAVPPIAAQIPPPMAKTSFDCQYARSGAEKLLCSDVQLSAQRRFVAREQPRSDCGFIDAKWVPWRIGDFSRFEPRTREGRLQLYVP